MPKALIERQLPSDLETQDPSRQRQFHVGEPVKASGILLLQRAANYLAGSHILQSPATMRFEAVNVSAPQTWKKEIARPIIPGYAIVRSVWDSELVRNAIVRASSGTQGLTTWSEGVASLGGGGAVTVDLQIEIGNAEPTVPGVEEVHLSLSTISGGTSSPPRLLSWAVIPLPHTEPWTDGEIEI